MTYCLFSLPESVASLKVKPRIIPFLRRSIRIVKMDLGTDPCGRMKTICESFVAFALRRLVRRLERKFIYWVYSWTLLEHNQLAFLTPLSLPSQASLRNLRRERPK
jgi:hypothetical protein